MLSAALSDYWPRFLSCLRALRAKRQRTVYRLTLVKGYNVAELADYAALVCIGRPTLIEIKGVTYCGETSAANELTMSNVPFHSEVRQFSQQLCEQINLVTASSSDGGSAEEAGLDCYELACEHEHSCCVLLASRRMRRPSDGRWMTHIDYDKFIDCVRRWEQSNGEADFGVEEYWSETPHWALYDSTEAGFNPTEARQLTTRPGKKSRQQLDKEYMDRQRAEIKQQHAEGETQRDGSVGAARPSGPA